MKLIDKLKNMFNLNKQESIDNQERKQEEFDILLNDIDKCALFFKNREKPFVLIKDKNFPFMLNKPDLDFIEMNKYNFEYYGDFFRLELMNEKILQLERKEELDKKTENDYLIEYLEHSKSAYSKIIEKMKTFEIDQIQYDDLINSIKLQIKKSVNNLCDNYKNANPTLETNRTYKEIIDSLMSFKSFTDKFPYKYYEKFRLEEDSISHCGYPDYMWQSGTEGNFIHLAKIPNSTNWVFEYNKYIGGPEPDDYIVKFAIVSDKEKETILKYWDELQYKNELQFEKDYMKSFDRRKENQHESQEDEESI